MKYYSPIPLENLETIQSKVLDIFPKDELSKDQSFFYIPDNLKTFFGIPELKSALDNLNWSPYVTSFGFYMVNKTEPSGTPIHTDTGDYMYSFNIPILNCTNTFLNFYKTDKEPVWGSFVAYDKTISYNSFETTDCILEDRVEMAIPHVIKVKGPHNVTNLNPLPRVTLLIRLNKELNLEHLFQ